MLLWKENRENDLVCTTINTDTLRERVEGVDHW